MAKIKHLLTVFIFLTIVCSGLRAQYRVHYRYADKDTAGLAAKAGLVRDFANRAEAEKYIIQLPAALQRKGFITASVDSLQTDTTAAQVLLFIGEQYRWAKIKSPAIPELLRQATGATAEFSGTVDFETLHSWQQRLLRQLEESGHPFGKTYLDSVRISGSEVSALLKIEPGPLYKIDSIRIAGNAKVSPAFLQRYLQVSNGSRYNRTTLQAISGKLAQLPYLQEDRPSDLTMQAGGSVLNLYLSTRRSSSVNALVGFLPNTAALEGGKKLLVTADVNILLRNALATGETISLVWQQLQQRSPRLNFLFDQPYAFRSPFGINFSLDMYKRDSSFLNIDMNLGTGYHIKDRKQVTLFLQKRQSIVSGINAASVIQTKSLPQQADVGSVNLGAGYNFYGADYRLNPHSGTELAVTVSTGTKRIKKNSLILVLKDPSDPSFQFESLYDTVKLKAFQVRLLATVAHYVPLGTQSTLKLGLNGGYYQSANYFRNELFRIGGIKLLRGFDDESQFVSQYAVGTAEYRYRLGLNSYFFGFADGGWGKHVLDGEKSHTYIGAGLGLSLETKAGLINLAWAVGKRDDADLNLRQSKIHVGFASYF